MVLCALPKANSRILLAYYQNVAWTNEIINFLTAVKLASVFESGSQRNVIWFARPFFCVRLKFGA